MAFHIRSRMPFHGLSMFFREEPTRKWKSNGKALKPLDKLWTTNWKAMGNPWKSNGQPKQSQGKPLCHNRFVSFSLFVFGIQSFVLESSRIQKSSVAHICSAEVGFLLSTLSRMWGFAGVGTDRTGANFFWAKSKTDIWNKKRHNLIETHLYKAYKKLMKSYRSLLTTRLKTTTSIESYQTPMIYKNYKTL